VSLPAPIIEPPARLTLRGMTWSHPRGYDPMVATAAEWRRRTGVAIAWDKRSLQDFESFPVAELARQYDLIVIDHPHVGEVTADGSLAALEGLVGEAVRGGIAAGSVGHSYESYTWAGHQWAFPIDAAAQVQVWRPDLIEAPARTWDEVLGQARRGRVVLPMLAPHSLMCFFTLAANLGTPCRTEGRELIDPAAGARVVEMLAEIAALIEPSNFAMDPIAASEAMARADALVALMPLGYGYVSYSRDGFRPRRLAFVDIPAAGGHGPVGSALGGTGIAVSALSAHRQEATDYAAWVASGEAQRGLYAASGGQPAHADAWGDGTVNTDTHGFYRGTRKTLDGAWLRPRHRGYMAFQDAAANRLNAGLIEREAASLVVSDLNRLFRESF
jgi:multiple sugar transport system substrate-binding protein